MAKPACKDCKSTSRRLRRPGPRCATCLRKKKQADKRRAHDLYVNRTYNLKPGEYDRIYEAQGKVCALCRRATGKTRRLAVDHDHACCPEPPTCGRCTRGILCKPCNRLLGHARDNIEFFERTIQYLKGELT